MDFLGLDGYVSTTPKVVCESPFHLGFKVVVQGDVMNTVFVGDKARALRNSIRRGDRIRMNGTIDNGTLVVGHVILEPITAIGRNLNVVG